MPLQTEVPLSVSVLVCTHNRADMLRATLESLCAARRPGGLGIEVVVVANACSDKTHAMLEDLVREGFPLPLAWAEEPIAGKSRALNRGLEMARGAVIAFVDDDQLVSDGYFEGLAKAVEEAPGADLFCGRLIPNWDGTEPAWVHDVGPFRILPPPIPSDDFGPAPLELTESDPTPAGGNLTARRTVFKKVGGFSEELGPHGHNLVGGEDQEFVMRCYRNGLHIHYEPAIVQLHVVEPARLRFGYLLRKSYQRTKDSILASGMVVRSVPAYVWRKAATHALRSAFSFDANKSRYYAIRLAATIGELHGLSAAARTAPDSPSRFDRWNAGVFALFLAQFAFITFMWGAAALGPASMVTAFFLLTSLKNYSRTGPELKEEIRRHYFGYSAFAFARLGAWSLLICVLLGGVGLLAGEGIARLLFGHPAAPTLEWTAAFIGIVVLTALQFSVQLLHIPGSIAASSSYRLSRFYPIWRLLTPRRLIALKAGLFALAAAGAVMAVVGSLRIEQPVDAALFAVSLTMYGALIRSARWQQPSVNLRTAPRKEPGAAKLNVLMIGVDTLRADRVGAMRDGRPLTPNIDALAAQGATLANCYVPCARTAPSLASLLTGGWPQRHGIRDNFVSPDEVLLGDCTLPKLLAEAGYRTVAVSDWAGADLGKFDFGFSQTDLSEDQWNIKYLIRQGPKDIRLFLSLFTHNRFGRRFLPELYYLGGKPMTDELGRTTRRLLNECAQSEEPFFMNVFFSTTHAPFASEFPYYCQFSPREYDGESKFVMELLNDPFEIIKKQRLTGKDFDVRQILALYDGCVRRFDDEVGRLMAHLGALGLREQTIIVIYSDHGIEFFERESWGQGNSVVVDGSARIPVVICDPRHKSPAVLREVTRSIDVAPTLLDLLGQSVPAEMDGTSLAPAIRGGDLPVDLVAYGETGLWFTRIPGLPEDHLTYPDLPELLEVPDKASGALSIKAQYKPRVLEAKDRMIRRGKWKVVRYAVQGGARYALFDLETDPDCVQDVSAHHVAIMDELGPILDAMVDDSARAPGRLASRQEIAEARESGSADSGRARLA